MPDFDAFRYISAKNILAKELIGTRSTQSKIHIRKHLNSSILRCQYPTSGDSRQTRRFFVSSGEHPYTVSGALPINSELSGKSRGCLKIHPKQTSTIFSVGTPKSFAKPIAAGNIQNGESLSNGAGYPDAL